MLQNLTMKINVVMQLNVYCPSLTSVLAYMELMKPQYHYKKSTHELGKLKGNTSPLLCMPDKSLYMFRHYFSTWHWQLLVCMSPKTDLHLLLSLLIFETPRSANSILSFFFFFNSGFE